MDCAECKHREICSAYKNNDEHIINLCKNNGDTKDKNKKEDR